MSELKQRSNLVKISCTCHSKIMLDDKLPSFEEKAVILELLFQSNPSVLLEDEEYIAMEA